jgi:hypothetical protein
MGQLVDPWTLRCYFSIERYVDRMMADEFTVEKKVGRNPVGPNSKMPKGSHHCLYKAFDKATSDPVFFAHIPVSPDGRHWPGWELDPKVLRYGGIRYQKDEDWVSPAERCGEVEWQKRVCGWFYARWRNFLCLMRGR